MRPPAPGVLLRVLTPPKCVRLVQQGALRMRLDSAGAMRVRRARCPTKVPWFAPSAKPESTGMPLPTILVTTARKASTRGPQERCFASMQRTARLLPRQACSPRGRAHQGSTTMPQAAAYAKTARRARTSRQRALLAASWQTRDILCPRTNLSPKTRVLKVPMRTARD